MVEKCPICDSDQKLLLKEYNFKFPGEDFKKISINPLNVTLWILFEKLLRKRDDFKIEILFCKSCGFIFLNPRPSQNDLKIHYEMVSELGLAKILRQRRPEIKSDKRAKRVYKLISKYYDFKFKSKTKPKLLDYGGAFGHILPPFIEKFKCMIIDYQKWELREGIEYIGKDLNDLDYKHKFDVILLLQTLEHINHPKEFLKTLSNHLTNDGIIYIEVPLGCFNEWKSLIDPLSHLNFFSEASLFKCLRLCDLKIIHLETKFQRERWGKERCINIIGYKNEKRNKLRIKRILSTEAQMSKISYKVRMYSRISYWKKFLLSFLRNPLGFRFNND